MQANCSACIAFPSMGFEQLLHVLFLQACHKKRCPVFLMQLFVSREDTFFHLWHSSTGQCPTWRALNMAWYACVQWYSKNSVCAYAQRETDCQSAGGQPPIKPTVDPPCATSRWLLIGGAFTASHQYPLPHIAVQVPLYGIAPTVSGPDCNAKLSISGPVLKGKVFIEKC